MTTHKTGTRDEWLAARLELLEAEKTLTRRGDEVARQRQELPWVRIDKAYGFETDEGSASLAGLFRGRSQLLVYHFMFGPEYSAGCPACSAIADGFNGFAIHLANHDVMLWAVSRAPLEKLQGYKQRMGWSFPWASSFGSDFNYDFHVSFTKQEIAAGEVYYNYKKQPFESEERSGDSVFYRDESGQIYHTYSTFGRGDEMLDTTYMYLDMTPLGRNEDGPQGNLMDWVKHHDRYEDKAAASSCCHGH
jgi:predicted dithiol-disulfide oxidoreductase (DUF899 family)